MNYVPFMVVESIHEEKNQALIGVQRRHNDGLMPQPPLMPDPIGLLCQQVLSVFYQGGVWLVALPSKQRTLRHFCHWYISDYKAKPWNFGVILTCFRGLFDAVVGYTKHKSA